MASESSLNSFSNSIPYHLLPDSVNHRVQELVSGLSARGFVDAQECISVAASAVGFLGRSYQQAEELLENSIDCSTLTSQSHWEGAAVVIPFLADSQRVGTSGIWIQGPRQILPGDVVIKYRSLQESPDGTHNHVGLVLGWDLTEKPIIIESVAGIGVRLTSLSEFDPKGGLKRFLPSPLHHFSSENARKALLLARQVPKLGRFGARQYSTTEQRFLHFGTDVYCPKGTEVHAPIEGFASRNSLHQESSIAVRIDSFHEESFVLMGNIEIRGQMRSDRRVRKGELIGFVDEPSPRSLIAYSAVRAKLAHLHIEFAHRSFLFPPVIRSDDWLFHNPLYACKLGLLAPPVEIDCPGG